MWRNQVSFSPLEVAQAVTMPKENLKDKLDGNELDLGLNNLTTVPVKDLVSIKW